MGGGEQVSSASRGKPHVLEQMGMQQLSGQGLSALASVSWKLPAAVSRWLRVQRSFGSLSPNAVNSGFPPWRQAFASPTTRRRARPVRRLPHPRLPGSAVPREFLPRLPSRVSLLARPARPARSSRGPPPPAPWAGSILGKISVRGAGASGSRPRESCARGSRRLPVGSRPLEPERALQREPVSCGVGVRSPGSGCRRTAAGAASSRAAGSPHVTEARRG